MAARQMKSHGRLIALPALRPAAQYAQLERFTPIPMTDPSAVVWPIRLSDLSVVHPNPHGLAPDRRFQARHKIDRSEHRRRQYRNRVDQHRLWALWEHNAHLARPIRERRMLRIHKVSERTHSYAGASRE